MSVAVTSVTFTLNGRAVTARTDETLWQVAARYGMTIPHLCWRPAPDYRPDGNCRLCVVEIAGERTLAASCIRRPQAGMVVDSESERVRAARRTILHLLLQEAPEAASAPTARSRLAYWAEQLGVSAAPVSIAIQELPESPDPSRGDAHDTSHPVIHFAPDACIRCTLCVRACRDVQGHDVLGLAARGAALHVISDQADPLGASRCVACGECVQACPTGALHPAVAASGGTVERPAEAKNVTPGTSAHVVAVPERVVATLCPYCGVGCQVSLHIRNDRIAKVVGRDGLGNHNRLCVKGRFGYDYIYHPHRLTTPLVRCDGKLKRADERVDPANPWTHFRPASWDEALERAAAGFRRIRIARGPAALAGFGSAKGSNEEAYLFQKLVRTGFGSNNVDHCTRLCHASSVAALMEGLGSGAVTVPVAEVANAEVIFVIGANPSVNHPVAASFIRNAVRRGATLIVADPRGQALSRHARHMLRFRPGTDVALLGALMATVVAEDLVNHEYIARHTEHYDAIVEAVSAFSPEAMAPVCGIDAATLRTVARLYATAKASMLLWGMGVSQHVHGTDNVRCLIALALMTGQIGRPGAGLHPLRGQNNVQGASDSGLIPMVYPDYRSVENPGVRAEYEAAWGVPLDPQRGLTVTEILDGARQGTIRGLYVMGENPAMSDPDLTHTREGLATLDWLVVQDIFLTETAGFADVILPASAFPEKTGTFTNTDRHVQMGRKALECPGQAREDWWIIQEMARRLGLGWSYNGPAAVYVEMQRHMPSLAGISWERLEREGGVTHPCPTPEHPGQAILFSDGHFNTASGRARFVPVTLTPPAEEPDADYPLILTTGRILEHWHTGTMTRRAPALDALEPAAVALCAPADLQRLGIAAGGLVNICTRRGRIRLTARADADVASGLVFVPFCFWEAPANTLTNPKLDPFGKIPEFKFCAARMEPVA